MLEEISVFWGVKLFISSVTDGWPIHLHALYCIFTHSIGHGRTIINHSYILSNIPLIPANIQRIFNRTDKRIQPRQIPDLCVMSNDAAPSCEWLMLDLR